MEARLLHLLMMMAKHGIMMALYHGNGAQAGQEPASVTHSSITDLVITNNLRILSL